MSDSDDRLCRLNSRGGRGRWGGVSGKMKLYMGPDEFHASETLLRGCCHALPKQTRLLNAAAIFTGACAARCDGLIICGFIIYLSATPDHLKRKTSTLSFTGLLRAMLVLCRQGGRGGRHSYLLPAQVVVHLYPLHVLHILLQPLVALPQVADVVAGLRQDAPFALGRTEMNGDPHGDVSRTVSSSGAASEGAYCSGLGAVNVAVWYDLGKRDDPVVDLVSSPPFD